MKHRWNPLAVALAAAVVARHSRLYLDHAKALPSFDQIGELRVFVIATVTLCTLIIVGEILLMLRPAWSERVPERVQLGLVTLLLITGVALPATMKSVARMKYGSERMILDSALHVEIGADLLLKGRNPYVEDYHGTALHRYQPGDERPALYHFVYPPFVVISAAAVRAVTLPLFGVYDQRLLILVCLMTAFLLSVCGMRGHPHRAALLAVVFLNPLTAANVEVGRLEGMLLLEMTLCVWALRSGRTALFGILCALAALTKTYMLALPPLALIASARIRGWNQGSGFWRSAAPWSIGFAAAASLILLPFLIWDAPALIEDVVLSVSGYGAHVFTFQESEYFGIGILPLQTGHAADLWSPSPLAPVQALLCLVILAVAARAVYERPDALRLMVGCAAICLVYFYFARFGDGVYPISLLTYVFLAVGWTRGENAPQIKGCNAASPRP